MPYGAAEIVPLPPSSGAIGCPGKMASSVSAHRSGRRRVPPPPCGMQKVLCRFRWLTSPPNRPGRARPTSALRLAPSTYTWPPASLYRCADVGDLVLVDTVRGRVGDHDRGETLGVIGDLRAQIVDVDVTVGTAGDNLDAHPGHDGRRPRWCREHSTGMRQVSRWSSPRLRW